MYQTGHTIEKTLEQVHRHDLVLPAIQREFVWRPEQIGRLFDSLMQGYPFGTFLYWHVGAENSGKFKFYDFVLDYHERDNPHCPAAWPAAGQATDGRTRRTATLDGAEHRAAREHGMEASTAYGGTIPMHFRSGGSTWICSDGPDEDNDETPRYCFEFLTEEEIENAAEDTCWFPVPDILRM